MLLSALSLFNQLLAQMISSQQLPLISNVYLCIAIRPVMFAAAFNCSMHKPVSDHAELINPDESCPDEWLDSGSGIVAGPPSLADANVPGDRIAALDQVQRPIWVMSDHTCALHVKNAPKRIPT